MSGELLDFALLVFRQQVAPSFVDTDLLRDRLGGVRVVAAQHQGLDAQRVQVLDCLATAVLDGVGHAEQRAYAVRTDQHHNGLALGFERGKVGLQRRGAHPEFLDQAMVAQVIERTVDMTPDTAPGQSRKVGHVAQGSTLVLRCAGHRLGDRMV